MAHPNEHTGVRRLAKQIDQIDFFKKHKKVNKSLKLFILYFRKLNHLELTTKLKPGKLGFYPYLYNKIFLGFSMFNIKNKKICYFFVKIDQLSSFGRFVDLKYVNTDFKT